MTALIVGLLVVAALWACREAIGVLVLAGLAILLGGGILAFVALLGQVVMDAFG